MVVIDGFSSDDTKSTLFDSDTGLQSVTWLAFFTPQNLRFRTDRTTQALPALLSPKMDVDTKKRAADEALEASVSKRSREDVAAAEDTAAAEVQPAPTTVSAVVAKAIVNEQPCTMVDVEVGISSYLTSELPGFGGILKQSCEDFLVNEIGTDGQVVRLTTTELPQEDCAKVVEEPQGDDDALKELKSILGDTHVQGIATLAQDPSLDAKFSAPGPNDKAARGNIHRLIRQLFPGVDSTSETDSATGICTMKFSRLSKTSKRGKKLKYVAIALRLPCVLSMWCIKSFCCSLTNHLYPCVTQRVQASEEVLRVRGSQAQQRY